MGDWRLLPIVLSLAASEEVAARVQEYLRGSWHILDSFSTFWAELREASVGRD